MVEIYMTLDGTPPAQQVILRLVESAYGKLLEAGVDESGASLWLIDTGYRHRTASTDLAPQGCGSVHAELTLHYGISSDPDRIHELIHGHMFCGAAEDLWPRSGVAFIAEPEHPPVAGRKDAAA